MTLERESIPPEDHWDNITFDQTSTPPPTYPPPTAGAATQWDLKAPDGQGIGSVTFNDSGLEYHMRFSDTPPSILAQQCATELMLLLRGSFGAGVPIPEITRAISLAYAGSYDASDVVLGAA